ncbi:MAG: rhomboid family protein [Anaerolineaceae bacterium]|nr:MAG: rhomboid family protein [Anaerolineaceae bacterium]
MNEYPTPQEYPQPQQPQPIQLGFKLVKPYATYVLFGLTVFVYLLQLAGEYLTFLPVVTIDGFYYDLATGLGIKYNDLIRQGQVWRLITPVFLHGSILHIAFNMYALFVYGRDLEARFGHGRFLLLYFVSAYTGNVLSFVLTPNPSLGASTAIFGLLAAEGMFVFQNRQVLGNRSNRVLMNVLYIAAINLFIGFTTTGVDNFGHLGGLLGGLLFTWFGGPRWKVEGLYPSLRLVDEREGHGAFAGTMAALLFFIPLTLMGWIWPR